MRRKVEPIVRKRISGCFPASKVHTAPKNSKNREKRAVRPIFLDFTRIFSILLPSGMLVAPGNRGFARKYAVSCAFPYLRRLCMPVLPLIRRFRFERQGSGDSALCALYPGPPCWSLSFLAFVHDPRIFVCFIGGPCLVEINGDICNAVLLC